MERIDKKLHDFEVMLNLMQTKVESMETANKMMWKFTCLVAAAVGSTVAVVLSYVLNGK